jgi:hypothetical protein
LRVDLVSKEKGFADGTIGLTRIVRVNRLEHPSHSLASWRGQAIVGWGFLPPHRRPETVDRLEPIRRDVVEYDDDGERCVAGFAMKSHVERLATGGETKSPVGSKRS